MYALDYVFVSLSGSLNPYEDPTEIEARASVSLLVASLASDINPELISMTVDQLKSYCQPLSGDTVSFASNDDGGIAMLLATESTKPRLNDLLRALETKENVRGAFGAVASSVTNLHTPKLFCAEKGSDDWTTFEKLINGVVGLKLKGNIAMRTIMVTLSIFLLLIISFDTYIIIPYKCISFMLSCRCVPYSILSCRLDRAFRWGRCLRLWKLMEEKYSQ